MCAYKDSICFFSMYPSFTMKNEQALNHKVQLKCMVWGRDHLFKNSLNFFIIAAEIKCSSTRISRQKSDLLSEITLKPDYLKAVFLS